MAFEDRCSPNQANSPGPVANGVPSSGPESPSSPNPNERNLKPYTCTTVPKYEKSKSPSSRMSPNLTYVKPQPVSPVETTPTNGVHPSIMYNPYYNPYLLNAIPMHPDYLRLYQHNPMLPPVDMKPLFLRQEALLRPSPRGENNDHEQGNDHVTDEDQERLHFSISNILKPEFGLNAIKKTTNKKEGPKPGGPVHSILYKPYDLTKSSLESKCLDNSSSQLTSRSPLENNKSLLERRSEYIQSRTNLSESPFKSAPLGNLCNTVSQIGTNKPFPPKNLSSFSNSQNGLKTEGNKSLSSFQPRDDYRRPDSANSSISTSSSNVSSQQGQTNGSEDGQSNKSSSADTSGNSQWPAWVFCTRYSDRPSSGPRSRRAKKTKAPSTSGPIPEDKRPRTAFSSAQLAKLKHEFAENRYLNERRRQQLSSELGLNEAQIKIWFQNKRAKIKKSSGQKNPLALQLMAQGLYNHGTASCSEGEDDDISVA